MTSHPLWHVYVRDDVAIIPTVSRTTVGYFLDTEPVAVSSVRSPDEFARALKAAITAGNPTIPTPTRDAFPKPVVLPYARVRSWKALERAATCFSIRQVGAEFELSVTSRGDDGEWVDSPADTLRIPASAGPSGIVERIISRISDGHHAV
jgi:hypothetical protein